MSAKRIVSIFTIMVCIGFGMVGCNVDGSWRNRSGRNEIASPVQSRNLFGQRNKNVDIKLVDISEVDLAESVALHRQKYFENLEQLKKYYTEHGYANKHKWASFELEGLRGVKRFRYLMDAEIPRESLKATDAIAQADTIFEKGLDLMKRGGHGIPTIYRKDRMIEAAEVFRSLITTYPTSDKIDDAAFFCGEIHKEYLPGQEEIAVRWYERAWTWNPEMAHPAMFQAAVIYDYRLHDRDRALELYQAVVKNPSSASGNIRFATNRIYDLTKARQGSSTQGTLAAPTRTP